MINIAERLAAQAQNAERLMVAAPAAQPQDVEQPTSIEYARAPAATGPQLTGARPPATQRSSR